MNNSGKVSTDRLAVVGTAVLCVLLIVSFVFPISIPVFNTGFLSIGLRQVEANPGIGDYSYKKQLTFNTTGISVTTNQTNFPICVHINTSSWPTQSERDAFFDTNTNGKRVRFYDSNESTVLDYEVEYFSNVQGSEEAIYWVEVPQVDGSSTTDHIHVGYGNDPFAADQSNSTGTWNSNFSLVNHMDYLPITANATNLGNVGECSLIMDGNQCDNWYPKADYYETLYYSYATDSDLNSYSAEQSCTIQSTTGTRFPFVLKEGSTYYLFAHNITGTHTWGQDVYLWSSTNKTSWSIMNGGNPVLHADANGIWKYIWNVGVVVIDGVWHLFAECDDEYPAGASVGLGYSYSTLADMNWDTHKAATHVVPLGINPHPVYVSDKGAVLMLMGQYNAGLTASDVVAYSASTSSNLSSAASWTSCRSFRLSYPAGTSTYTADPHLVVAGDAFDYNIVISFMYNQNANYQAYIDLSLNDFYDRIRYPIDSTSNQYDGSKRGTFEPNQIAGKVAGGQDFDGTNDGITIPDFYLTTFSLSCLFKMDVVADWKFFINKDNEVAREYNICLYESKPIFYVWTSGDVGYRQGSTVIQAATWYQLDATYDGTTLKIYINGTEESYTLSDTTSGNPINTAQSVTLGYRPSGTPNGFVNGQEDEVRISSGANTAGWVKLQYYSMKKTNFNGDGWLSWGSQEAITPTITSSPDSYGFGILAVNTTANTTIAYFTLNNTGNCPVDVTIQGTSLTGGDDTWTLSGTATPGENIYGLKAGLDDDDDLFDVVVNATANAFVADLAEAVTQAWGLKLWMPTSVTNYDAQQMSGNITLIASAA